MKLSSKAEVFNLDGMSFWSGIDVGDVPTTPFNSDGVVLKSDHTSENILFRLAMEEGLYVKAYAAEKRGAMVHNVIPIPGKEKSLSNQGSCKFPMHVEAPHLTDRPDFLALLCLRGNPDAVTRWAHMDDILSRISLVDQIELSKPQFALKVGESWGQEKYIVIPIIERSSLRLNLAYTQGLTSNARFALSNLAAILSDSSDVVKRVVMKKGDLMLLNNHRCVHGRDSFDSTYDGNHRWLQRVYLKWPE